MTLFFLEIFIYIITSILFGNPHIQNNINLFDFIKSFFFFEEEEKIILKIKKLLKSFEIQINTYSSLKVKKIPKLFLQALVQYYNENFRIINHRNFYSILIYDP